MTVNNDMSFNDIYDALASISSSLYMLRKNGIIPKHVCDTLRPEIDRLCSLTGQAILEYKIQTTKQGE